MITEEEYRQYFEEIDQYIEEYYKKNKDAEPDAYTNTDKWQNDLRIKSLKAGVYRCTKHAREDYYYLTHPNEAVRKKLNIDEAEKSYDEALEKLENLKFSSKIFYSSPHLRRQYVDDNMDIEDIQKEIDKVERRLESLERRINAVYDYNKIEKVTAMYERHYINDMQQLNYYQKELNEIENN